MSISDDEKKLFRDAVSDVKPFKPSQHIAPELKQTKKPKKIFNQPSTDVKRVFHFTEKYDTVSSDDMMSFAKPGLQHKRFAQFKKGKIKIEATLDLHGHTRDEALIAVDDFLKSCQQNGLRTVCIIHGKSQNTANTAPILKNLINHYLREHPSVLAFHSAKHYHGGSGAVYVLLKVPISCSNNIL